MRLATCPNCEGVYETLPNTHPVCPLDGAPLLGRVKCQPDCSRCTEAAWAWANVTEFDGHSLETPPTCATAVDGGCPYCYGREPNWVPVNG